MKYSYFNTNRSGLSHIRNLGMYNNKTVTHIFKCHYAEGNPLCAVIFKPQESIQTWYWEDKEESIPCDYDIDYVKLMDDLRRRPRPKHWINGNRGRYYAPIKKGITSPIFYKSFPKIFESDYILYALPMLGYIGKGKDIDERLRNDNKNVVVDLKYSIEQFRKRINIIPYKEDIRHMAREWFINNYSYKEDWYENISERINYGRQFHKRVEDLFRRLDIPYRLFSLDTGDYRSIGLEKDLPRNHTEGIDPTIPESVMERLEPIVDRYMNENP